MLLILIYQIEAAEIVNIDFVSPIHDDIKSKASSLRSSQQLVPLRRTALCTGPQHTPHIEADKLFSTLHQCAPSACLFTIIPVSRQSSIPASVSEAITTSSFTVPSSVFSSTPPSLESVVSASKVSSTVQLPPVLSVNSLPKPLTDLYSDVYHGLNREQLLEKAKEIFKTLALSNDASRTIEYYTRAQRESSIWHAQRRGRITASSFHDVFVLRATTDPSALVKRLLTENENLSSVPALSWGIESEDAAKMEYIKQIELAHVGFECSPAGLVINPSFPHLGATPDGFIQCNCCGKGIIEVKCPFSGKDCHPDELKIVMKNSFLDDNGLVRSHRYYTQVQGQLFICSDKDFCDFVVWTPKGVSVQRIYKDFPFQEKLLAKLNNFFVECLLPELMTHNILDAGCSSSVSQSSPNVPMYCICQAEKSGKMILCDNKKCKYKWFHFVCVHIKKAPKGAWYCSECSALKC